MVAAVMSVSALPGLGAEEQNQSGKDSPPTRVFNFQFFDPIEDNCQREQFVKLVKTYAKRKLGTCAIMISIDCPGGEPNYIAEMVYELSRFPNPTIAYVGGGRYQGVYNTACALVFACDKVVVHPGSHIGSRCSLLPKPVGDFPKFDHVPIPQDRLETWLVGTQFDTLACERLRPILAKKAPDTQILKTIFIAPSDGAVQPTPPAPQNQPVLVQHLPSAQTTAIEPVNTQQTQLPTVLVTAEQAKPKTLSAGARSTPRKPSSLQASLLQNPPMGQCFGCLTRNQSTVLMA